MAPAAARPAAMTRGGRALRSQSPGENAEQGRGQRRRRAQDALGIVDAGRLPDVRPEERSIEVGGQVAFLAQVARAIAGNRNDRHRDPVAQQEGGGDRRVHSPARHQVEQGREKVAHGDPLQHTGDSQCPPLKPREPVEHDPEGENDGGPPEHPDHHPSPPGLGRPGLEGQRDRHPDDEQEKGEDHVGRGPAMPVGVQKRRIDGAPGAGVVHDHHPGHGETAEGIEGNEPRHPPTVHQCRPANECAP